MPYKPGEVLLEAYRIEELIAEGSFGEVYRVTHLGLKVERAIKVLKRSAPGVGSTAFSDYHQRFQMEAQLGAELNTPSAHPNLLQVHNFQQEKRLLVLEMEYASGGSLAERISRARKTKQPIPLEDVIQIGIDVASGLAELHELDIVHRDLKPSNILFDNKGRAKVADLGLAQIPSGPSMRTKLSEPPPHPYTPGYPSPEQKNTIDYLTSASDIYTLGLVLFEALTGRICVNQPSGTRARFLRRDVPKWLDDLIDKMLFEDPQERPWYGANVAELLKRGDQVKKCFGKLPVWVCISGSLVISGVILAGILTLGKKQVFPMPTSTQSAQVELSPTSSHALTLTSLPKNTITPIPSKTITTTPTQTLTNLSTPTNSPTETPTSIIYVITISNNAAGYRLFITVSTLNDGWSTHRAIEYGGTSYIGLPIGKYQVSTDLFTGQSANHPNSFTLTLNSNIEWHVDSRNYFDDF